MMKLFKKNVSTLLILFSFIFSQDIEGNYKLSGLGAVYYDFVRQETSLMITDNHGIGITVIGDTYEQGEVIRYEYQLPTPEEFLIAAGVQLYVNFYEDGTASIAQGSTYPTSTTENCISSLSSLPIEGDQGYSSNINSNAIIPEIDIVGLPSKSIYAGQSSGSCSISSSPVFDVFPQVPVELTIPFPINTATISEELGTFIPANTVLPGQTAGYALLDSTLVSTIEKNTGTRPSLYLEWHAIDGPVNDSGLGDIIGEDEDGDNTDYDSIYGHEIIRTMYNTNITELNCGNWNYPVAGRNIIELQSIKEQQCISEGLDSDCITYADNWIDNCIDKDKTVAENNDVENLYVLDNNPLASTWGGLFTWNRYYSQIIYEELFTNCLSQGGDSPTCYSIATNNEEYLTLFNTDDSDHDFNDECLSDGDYSDCSGRLTFSYSPQCVPSFSVRYFMAELTELCELSEQDECGVCGGGGPVTWYNDADRDGLGDPNNYKTNCLPGYCIENELLSYTDCSDAGFTWDWLSMGICSNGNGTIYENLNPNMGDFEFCNYIMDNDVSGYENATWDWDRGFSTNNSDSDDTCINVDMYHNCNGNCINDSDGDNVCDEDDIYPNCPSNIVDCAEVCNGLSTLDDCGICDSDSTNNNTTCTQDCNDEWGGTAEEDECDVCNGNGCFQQNCNTYPSDEYDCNGILLSLGESLPDKFSIQSVYPNPFNPVVTIYYGVPVAQNIEGSIINLVGKRVSTVLSHYQPAGNYSIEWNATGNPSGIYIFILKTESEVKSQKLVLLK